jgi:hypothetical protein
MLTMLLSPDYILFAIAFVIMLGVGVIETIGLGIGHFDMDANLDAGSGASSGLLDWLGLRTGLPRLIWLTSLLGCFTIVGIAIQQISTGLLGMPLHWGVAGVLALVVGSIANGYAAAGLARLFPEYESSIVDVDDLIMRRCTVLEGTAKRGRAARAKVVDQHRQAHYIMVEPHHDGDMMTQGDTGLLVRRSGPLFFVQPESSSDFRPL